MLLQMQRDHCLNHAALIGIEVSASDEMIGDRPRLIACPRLKSCNELALVDQSILQSEQSKQQVPVGGGHGSCLRGMSKAEANMRKLDGADDNAWCTPIWK